MRNGGDRERLLDILEAIDRIERYVLRGRIGFDSDELIQTWLLHHLQIIGEASRQLSEDFKVNNPDVPWTNIIGMRHILVHDYFLVDLDVVWTAAAVHVPLLKVQVQKMLEKFPTD